MADNPERNQPKEAEAEREEAAQRIREAAEKRREAQKQSTPEADADDTTEGEGSPGLTIMGGGGHA